MQVYFHFLQENLERNSKIRDTQSLRSWRTNIKKNNNGLKIDFAGVY